MNRQYIVERFALISGLSMNEAAKWADICAEAGEQIENKIKPNVNLDDVENQLCAVAAALALYRYAMYQNSTGQAESFTVGDISVSSSANAIVDAEKAKEVFEEARLSASDYLVDIDFTFMQVKS